MPRLAFEPSRGTVRRPSRHFAFVALALLLVTAAGCMDMSEEIWFHADGSARYRSDASLPSDIVEGVKEVADTIRVRQAALQKDLLAIPGVRAASVRDTILEGAFHMILDVTLDKAEDLPRIIEKTNAREDGPPGRITTTVTHEPGGIVKFRREARSPSFEEQVTAMKEQYRKATEAGGLPEVADSTLREQVEANEPMTRQMLQGRFSVLRVHAPSVVSSNAQAVSPDGTLEWRVPLDSLFTSTSHTWTMQAALRTAKASK